MALFAIKIPEYRRVAAKGEVGQPNVLNPLRNRIGMGKAIAAGQRDARQIAFHVGEEHRHASCRKLLGNGLQGHGLAGASRACDQSVAVGHAQPQGLPLAIVGQSDEDIFHSRTLPRLCSTG